MRALLFILALIVGAASGLGATWLMSSRDSGFGAIQIGAWRAWPKSGTTEADPYARAIFARSGELPLGLAEGIVFIATADERGRALDGRCVIRLFGKMLPARLWSIAVYDARGRLIDNPATRYGFTSTEVLYQADGNVEIWLSPRVREGNWLPTGENERIAAVVRLYDTPTGVFSRAEVAEMPKLVTERCP